MERFYYFSLRKQPRVGSEEGRLFSQAGTFSNVRKTPNRLDSGFSFEAGGRMFHPVVFHSMSGTLISIFEGLLYYFNNIICFYLSVS